MNPVWFLKSDRDLSWDIERVCPNSTSTAPVRIEHNPTYEANYIWVDRRCAFKTGFAVAVGKVLHVGADTVAILDEMGFSEDDIQQLLKSGAVRTHSSKL